jgi:hypothetical protein
MFAVSMPAPQPHSVKKNECVPTKESKITRNYYEIQKPHLTCELDRNADLFDG